VTLSPDLYVLLIIATLSFGLGMIVASWLVWRSSRYVPHYTFNVGILFFLYAVISLAAIIINSFTSQ
jgi:hypothetical protein